jgi:hypothetical protein
VGRVGIEKIIVREFFDYLINQIKASSTLNVNLSNFDILNESGLIDKQITSEEELKNLSDSYAIIVGDFPLGLRRVQNEMKAGIKFPKNWWYILKASSHISPSGRGYFFMEPHLFYTKTGGDFIACLAEMQMYITAVILPPRNLYQPHTSFRPLIVQVEDKREQDLFLGEIDRTNKKRLAKNLISRTNSGNLLEGELLIGADKFHSFERHKISKEIAGLQTQYKEYNQYTLKELSTNIRTTRDTFNHEPNSVYIPRLGNSAIISDVESLNIKPENYFQVQLNDSLVLAEYLPLFFNSKLGQFIFESLKSGNYIPKIKRNDIENCLVAVPSLQEQLKLVNTGNKITDLQGTVRELKMELSLNPRNADIILDKLDGLQQMFKSLTQEDEILGLIRKGEGKTLEFKETFTKNVRTDKKDTEIQKSSLKNIVGFFNSEGGTLLIGVSDDGGIKGVEQDFYHNDDKYLLHFKNILKSKIGSDFYPLIKYDLIPVMGKKILRVDCQASEEPCFLDGKEFYVRTNPATDKLEGKELISYINRHFKRNE